METCSAPAVSVVAVVEDGGIAGRLSTSGSTATTAMPCAVAAATATALAVVAGTKTGRVAASRAITVICS